MKLRYEIKKENDKFCIYEVFVDGFFIESGNKIGECESLEVATEKKNALDCAKAMLEELSRMTELVKTQKELQKEVAEYIKKVAK